MSSIINTTKIDTESKLSTLWTMVMFFIITIDILSFTINMTDISGFQAELLKTTGDTPVSLFMLGASVFMALPIAMIFLSRILKQGINRWTNIIIAIITIVFVVGGYSAFPHYYFLGALEVLCMLVIIWTAWKWHK